MSFRIFRQLWREIKEGGRKEYEQLKEFKKKTQDLAIELDENIANQRKLNEQEILKVTQVSREAAEEMKQLLQKKNNLISDMLKETMPKKNTEEMWNTIKQTKNINELSTVIEKAIERAHEQKSKKFLEKSKEAFSIPSLPSFSEKVHSLFKNTFTRVNTQNKQTIQRFDSLTPEIDDKDDNDNNIKNK